MRGKTHQRENEETTREERSVGGRANLRGIGRRGVALSGRITTLLGRGIAVGGRVAGHGA